MPVTIDYSKLRILSDPDTREWWDATRQHKYLVRQCDRCGHKWFPPNLPACSKCMSMDIGWFETAGTGVIHSYVVVTQPIVGAFIGNLCFGALGIVAYGTIGRFVFAIVGALLFVWLLRFIRK